VLFRSTSYAPPLVLLGVAFAGTLLHCGKDTDSDGGGGPALRVVTPVTLSVEGNSAQRFVFLNVSPSQRAVVEDLGSRYASVLAGARGAKGAVFWLSDAADRAIIFSQFDSVEELSFADRSATVQDAETAFAKVGTEKETLRTRIRGASVARGPVVLSFAGRGHMIDRIVVLDPAKRDSSSDVNVQNLKGFESADGFFGGAVLLPIDEAQRVITYGQWSSPEVFVTTVSKSLRERFPNIGPIDSLDGFNKAVQSFSSMSGTKPEYVSHRTVYSANAP
jgi:hypothetical protein